MDRRAIVIGSFLLALAGPAVAGQAPEPRRVVPKAPPTRAQPQMPAREASWPGREAWRPPQLSPEEREQLRRDIHQHGREIYRDQRGAKAQP